MGKTAIYPGSFDPITNGHLDLIQRGLKIFDEIIITIAVNPVKQPLFTIKERIDLIHEVLKDQPRVRIDHFTGLLVDFVRRQEHQRHLTGIAGSKRFRLRIPAGLDEPPSGAGNRDGIPHDQPEMGLFKPSILKEAVSLGGLVEDIVPRWCFIACGKNLG